MVLQPQILNGFGQSQRWSVDSYSSKPVILDICLNTGFYHKIDIEHVVKF